MCKGFIRDVMAKPGFAGSADQLNLFLSVRSRGTELIKHQYSRWYILIWTFFTMFFESSVDLLDAIKIFVPNVYSIHYHQPTPVTQDLLIVLRNLVLENFLRKLERRILTNFTLNVS